MSRALLVLSNKAVRDRAMAWVANAPVGTRLEFREARRSHEQNDRMWAMLTDIARQRPVHNGVKMTPDLWKAVFLEAAGSELTWLPKLEGDGLFPLGLRSSELSKAEMSGLIELMFAWGAVNEIQWTEQRAAA